MDSGAVRRAVDAGPSGGFGVADVSRRLLPGLAAVSAAGILFVGLALNEPFALVAGSESGQAAKDSFERDLAALETRPIDFDLLQTLRHGAVAYEDRGYFDRPSWVFPISPRGTLRAIWRNLNGVREGGSTIPAQLAKLYMPPNRSRSVRKKFEELLLATWMVRQADPDEILSLYLNRSAARFFAHDGVSAGQLERLSLALFGLPLGKLSREDQLLLAATPRGVRWHRKRPSQAALRIGAARQWLTNEGRWDASEPSLIDDIAEADVRRLFSFVEGWEELVATEAARGADLDLARAVDGYRTGLADDVLVRFPGASLRTALVVTGAHGAVYARSGVESSVMLLNYGSIAKLEPLAAAVEYLGVEPVRALRLPPGRCVRWFWTRHRGNAASTQWCPSNVGAAKEALALDEAVARSVNDITAQHVALIPYRIARAQPAALAEFRKKLDARVWAALDSKSDRAIAANLLFQLGETTAPEDVSEDLSYSPLQRAWFRLLNARRESAGLSTDRLPEDPTQTLGNSSRATLEQIAHYAHRRFFRAEAGCRLSSTGALLALHRKEGTLRWLAAKRPALEYTGKTGTSPHDDAVVAVVGLCLEGRPVVLAAGARSTDGKLPDGLHGSVLLRGIHAYLTALERLGRTVRPLQWPAEVAPNTSADDASPVVADLSATPPGPDRSADESTRLETDQHSERSGDRNGAAGNSVEVPGDPYAHHFLEDGDGDPGPRASNEGLGED